MSTDLRVVMHEMGFTDLDGVLSVLNKQRRPNEKSNKTSILYDKLWATIPKQTVDDIMKIFGLDMELFGYPTSPF